MKEKIINTLIKNTFLAHLLMQLRAFWCSCSAKSYSEARISTCSKVTDIPVLSLALLQLVNLKPKIKKIPRNKNIV